MNKIAINLCWTKGEQYNRITHPPPHNIFNQLQSTKQFETQSVILVQVYEKLLMKILPQSKNKTKS